MEPEWGCAGARVPAGRSACLGLGAWAREVGKRRNSALASRAGAPSFHCEMQLCQASLLATVTEDRRACAVYERLGAGE